MSKEKNYVYGFAEDLSPQIKLCPQIENLQGVTFAEGPQILKCLKTANMRTCYLRNLFADCPPMKLCATGLLRQSKRMPVL